MVCNSIQVTSNFYIGMVTFTAFGSLLTPRTTLPSSSSNTVVNDSVKVSVLLSIFATPPLDPPH